MTFTILAILAVSITQWLVHSSGDDGPSRAQDFVALLTCLAGIFVMVMHFWRYRRALELKSREDRYERAVAGSTDGLWDYDVATGNVWYSDRFKELLGLDPATEADYESHLDSWIDRLHEDDRQETSAALDRHLREKTPYDVTYRLIHPNGGPRWFRARGQAEWDRDGKPTRMAGSLTDIHEQRIAEQRTLDIATRLELAHKSANAGIWDWDVAAGALATNATFFTMIGEEPAGSEIPQSYFFERLHPNDIQTIERNIEMAHSSDEYMYDVEFRLRCADQSYKWIRSTGKVIARDSSGLPLRMTGQHMDITQQKELESSLRESRNLADTVNCDLVGINLLHHILFSCRTQAEVADTISNVLVEKFGVDFAGLWLRDSASTTPHDGGIGSDFTLIASAWAPEIHRGPEELIPPDHVAIGQVADEWGKTVCEATAADGNFDDEFISRHDMSAFAGFPLTRQSDVIGVVAMYSRQPILPHRVDTLEVLAQLTAAALRNVQQIDDLLNSRRAAENANLAKSEFLANMSHEIRTPMTAILGYADILAKTFESHSEANDAVNTIRHNGRHLLTIVNDILDMSKIEARQMTTERMTTSPAALLNEVISLMHERATAKNVPLVLQCEGPLPETIESDPTRLRQILLNLLGNAIKFTSSGNVTILVSLTNTEASPALRIQVRDTGIGMTPDQCVKLLQFEAFSQADTSTTREFGGTGLGLRISDALAKLLGGKIEVQSTLGVGSTIGVTVDIGDISTVPMLDSYPLEKVGNLPASSTDGTDQDNAPLRGMWILLVEDGLDNQRLLSFLLRKAGADVEIAENGEVAVARLESSEREFDVILMDMQMPILDGYAATRLLRDRGYELPIIALTAHAMSEDRAKCLDAGCDDFLTKPIDRDLLIDTCRKWIPTIQAANSELRGLKGI
jgi:PAS domain S-box-containing protein